MSAEAIFADSLDWMADQAKCSFDSVITDPDWGVASDHQAAGGWAGWEIPYTPDGYQEYSRRWAVGAYGLVRPGGWLVAFGAQRTIHRITAGIEDAGWDIHTQLAWEHNQGQLLGTHIRHEGWSTKLRPTWDPIVLARKPLPRGGKLLAHHISTGLGLLNIEGVKTMLPDDKWPSTVLRFSKVGQREVPEGFRHSTPKPLSLMRYLVRLTTPPGGRVLDPFCGSGATVEAALLEGMAAVGVDRVEDHVRCTQARIDRQNGR